MSKLVVFDLGETLVNYEGMSLNWSDNYIAAIQSALIDQGIRATKGQLELSVSILNFYNTRVNPRSFEVSEGEVTDKVAKVFKADERRFERKFFAHFQRKSVFELSALETLTSLQNSDVRTAVLSDVPYGMPKEFLLEDLGFLTTKIDAVVSSSEVGFRKPNPVGLISIANQFHCPIEMVVFVGNEEKDISCANEVGAHSVLLSLSDAAYGQAHTVRSLRDILPLVL